MQRPADASSNRGKLDSPRPFDFWQSDNKIFREPAARGSAQSADKKIEGANASFAQLGRKRLDAYADEGRQGALAHSTRHLFRGKFRVLVFFGVGTIPVAVFEVDAKIFDGLTLEFFEHSSINRVRQPRGPIFGPEFFGRSSESPLQRNCFTRGGRQHFSSRQSHGTREGKRMRRVLAQSRERQIA